MSTQDQGNKVITVNSSTNLNLIREVPMNLGAEQALLGAILSNNQAFEKIEEFLKPENTPWIHIDTFAWSNGSYLSTKGAALQGLDIMIEFLQNNYS